MPSFDEIVVFVCDYSGVSRAEVAGRTSLQEIGYYGLDFDILMFEYSKRFGVNLAGYLWYFHTCEDGTNFGGLLFAPPNARVRQIPITLELLHKFANQGRWAIQYPKHKLPRWRLDTLVNAILAIGMIGLVVVSCLWQAIF